MAEWKGGKLVAGDDAADARWVPINEIDGYKLRPLTYEVILEAHKLRKSGSLKLSKRTKKTI